MPDISMCSSDKCPSRDTCYRHTATPSEYQWWADFEATRDGRDRCDHYANVKRGVFRLKVSSAIPPKRDTGRDEPKPAEAVNNQQKERTPDKIT